LAYENDFRRNVLPPFSGMMNKLSMEKISAVMELDRADSCLEALRVALVMVKESSTLKWIIVQIQRPGFDSRRYQIF
jgi:hypothetical protein